MEVLICEVDMLKEEDIEGMLKRTVEKWGRLDYAVNAAGIPYIFVNCNPDLRMSDGSWLELQGLMLNRSHWQQCALNVHIGGTV